MYTPEERLRLRTTLLEHAAHDPCISGAAITGSAAADREDRWSDIDLAFGVAEAAQLPAVLSDWTAHMYQQHLAVHHVDVTSGAWIYRVFLLPGTLQVDLAFVPAAEFSPLAPTFRLIFGQATQPRHLPPPAPADLIGLAWLYALHVRSSIARHKLWQAEYMIAGVRNHALTLACIRHDLPAVHGRGIDQLPAAVITPFEDSLVRRLDLAELSRAFEAVLSVLLSEAKLADPQLAARLESSLRGMSESLLA